MPILSMTGFGRSSATIDGRDISVELRSVNHRYFDARIKLPSFLVDVEAEVRSTLNRHVERGRVELNVQIQGEGDAGILGFWVDNDLAQALVNVHDELAAEFNIPNRMDSRLLAGHPGVVKARKTELGLDEQRRWMEAVLPAAIEALVEMRRIEGQRLESIILAHLDKMESLREFLVERAPEMAAQHQAKLESRIREVLGGQDLELDEGRILHEVAIFADRTDLVEEVERLSAHFDHARRLIELSESDAVGRRLDFLCQEILRETNTVGSKATDLGITETVVALKGELERLREQIQNVE